MHETKTRRVSPSPFERDALDYSCVGPLRRSFQGKNERHRIVGGGGKPVVFIEALRFVGYGVNQKAPNR